MGGDGGPRPSGGGGSDDPTSINRDAMAEPSFRALAEVIDDAVILWSCLHNDVDEIIDFVYEYVNPAAARTIDIAADQLVGQRLLDVYPDHIEKGLFDRYRRVATTGVPDLITFPWFEGGEVAGSFEANVTRIGAGLVFVARNVTDRVLAEQRVRSSEARSRMVLEHANDVTFHIVDGVIEWASPAVERLIGVSADELSGTRAAAWCHPDNAHLLDRVSDHAATPPRGRLRSADGTWRWVEANVRRHHDAPVAGTETVSHVAVVRDIEPERAAIAAADRAELRLAKVLNSVRDAVVVVGNDGRNRFSNAANNRLLGYSSEELAEIPARDWIHPDDFETVLEHLDHLAKGAATTFALDVKVVDRDGRVIPVSLVVTDMTDDPMIGGVVGTMRDLTNEIAAASQLAESEERHRKLMSVIPDAVIVVENGVITFGNDAALQLCGVTSQEELIGSTLADFQSPEVVAASMDYGKRFVATGVADEPLVGWMHRADGTPVKVEGTPATIPGNAHAILIVLRDVTERDRLTTELAESEAIGRFLTDNSTDVLLRVDEEHRVVYASTATNAVLEQPSEHIIGVPLTSLFAPDDHDMIATALHRAVENGAEESFEVQARRAAHGQYVWVEVSIRAVTLASPAGKIVHEFHVTLYDITRQREDRLALASSERWMRTLVDGAPIGIFELDPIGNCTFVNARYCEILGVEGLDDVAGTMWHRMIHPDDAPSVGRLWGEARTSGDPFEIAVRFVRPDGVVVQTEIGVAPVLDGDEVVSWLGTVDDVTDRVQLEQARREAAELFVVAFDHAPAGLLLMSIDAFPPQVIKANTAQLELTGLTYEELVGVDFYETTHADDLSAALAGRAALLAGEIDTHHMEVRQRFHTDAPWRWLSLVRTIVRDGDGKALYILAQSTDITERKETEQRHYQLAVTDPLTGLSNRRHFEDRLTNTHARLLRSNVSLGIVFLDLDHFKAVNDGLGHRAGDELLQRIAGLMTTAVRPGDTVARLGGDEFAVLTELDDDDDLVNMAERLRGALDVECELPDGTVHRVTASIGLASRRASEIGPHELIQLADQAMYCAKRDGRHRWAIADQI